VTPLPRRPATLALVAIITVVLTTIAAYLWRGSIYTELRNVGLMKPRSETEEYRRIVEQQARANAFLPPDCVLLLGDSITWEFPETLTAPRHWVNRGISGDRVRDVRARVEPSALSAPCGTISLLVGSNDLVGDRTPSALVADGILALAKEILDSGRRVVLNTLPPTRDDYASSRQAVRDTNQRLVEHAPHRGSLILLDLHEVLADSDGALRSDYSRDGLHLTPAAYDAWARALAAAIAAPAPAAVNDRDFARPP